MLFTLKIKSRPKDSGHLLGKQVVSHEEFLVRIRAAVMARDSMPEPSDFVCNAFNFFLTPNYSPWPGVWC
jgi:hypothetical protein